MSSFLRDRNSAINSTRSNSHATRMDRVACPTNLDREMMHAALQDSVAVDLDSGSAEQLCPGLAVLDVRGWQSTS